VKKSLVEKVLTLSLR